MSDDAFYQCLTEANSTLLKNYYDMAKKQALEQVTNLYKNRQVGFRGFRQM
jgi:hypothetical protein|tara:strand:+ start:388 stop:540 length:153 start_codon:yes stop_codon:yes gene_type:complete